MFIDLKKVRLLLRKTFFLYVILILLGLNSYLDVSFASQTPSKQSYFDGTPSFSLSIESTDLPILWSRQIAAPISIPEPEIPTIPLATLTPIPYPSLIPSPSPSPELDPEILFSILDKNENPLNAISWGTLIPNGEYNKTLILNNKGTNPLNFTMKTENWQPLEAKSFISTSLYQNLSRVDSQGVIIEPFEKIELKIFLKISSLIEGINEFEMDFIFTATNTETNDQTTNITITSKPV